MLVAHSFSAPRLLTLACALLIGLNGTIACSGNSEGNGDGHGDGDEAPNALLVETLTAEAAECLPRELPVDDDGRTLCRILEVAAPVENVGFSLDCAYNGRASVDDRVGAAARSHLETSGICDVVYSCNDMQICEIEQLSGAAREQCLIDPSDSNAFDDAGFCYIDPLLTDSNGEFIAGGSDSAEFVASCPATSQRQIRFAGYPTPVPNTFVLIVCE